MQVGHGPLQTLCTARAQRAKRARCPGVALAVPGVMLRSLLPSPLHAPVAYHPPHCVSLGMLSVGLLFLYGALDS